MATGCRLSAICTPSAIGKGALSTLPIFTRTAPPSAPSGTRAISIFSAAITRLPSAAPNCTCGAGVVARAEAAAFDRDFTARQGCCGVDAFDSRGAVRFQFDWSRCCHVSVRNIKPAGLKTLRSLRTSRRYKIQRPALQNPTVLQNLKAGCAREPQSDCGVNACDPVVCHDAPAAGKGLGLSRWERLPDIENAKKYKTQQQIFPVERSRMQARQRQDNSATKAAMLSTKGARCNRATSADVALKLRRSQRAAGLLDVQKSAARFALHTPSAATTMPARHVPRKRDQVSRKD